MRKPIFKYPTDYILAIIILIRPYERPYSQKTKFQNLYSLIIKINVD